MPTPATTLGFAACLLLAGVGATAFPVSVAPPAPAAAATATGQDRDPQALAALQRYHRAVRGDQRAALSGGGPVVLPARPA